MADASTTNELLLGILTLLADEREQRARQEPDSPRTELVLDAAGLSVEVIAKAVGKNPNAVRMTIARAKAAAAKKQPARKTAKGE